VTESQNRGQARDTLDRAGQERERRSLYLEENTKHCVKKKERQNSRRTSPLIYTDPLLNTSLSSILHSPIENSFTDIVTHKQIDK
jgi:hypothetical protein